MTMEEGIIVNSELCHLPKVVGFVEKVCKQARLSEKSLIPIAIVIEEIFTNIVHHAYSEGIVGTIEVNCRIRTNPRKIEIVFMDDGKAYNPLEQKDPDTTLPVEERAVGGLGILIVKKWVDNIRYTHKQDRNHLSIEKVL
ncbi:MAG: ATP-binding protein [Puniceicoccales bacterium]|jgi:anti-sigma regulatory factor (Ser/Thr protein kinase)|nr:ATP-binding protein [Puniceicoccales bacterium]